MIITEIGNVKFTQEQAAEIFLAMRNAVLRSFNEDERRGDNQGKGHGRRNETEVRRRWSICEEHVMVMRRESGFSTQRICDRMYDCLRRVLDGEDPELITKSSLWAPF